MRKGENKAGRQYRAGRPNNDAQDKQRLTAVIARIAWLTP